MNHNRWTYVGKLPEHVRFELKSLGEGCGLPTCNENYIVLPLDTTIKTAKELCNNLIGKGIMTGNDYIAKWDVLQQNRMTPFVCSYSGQGFNLEPGVPYLITVTNPGNWTQE